MMSYVTRTLIITLLLNCYQAEDLPEKCECGVTNVTNRIVNGWAVKPHQYPWTVPILKFGSIMCGGTIINNKYILTAGHCVRWTDKDLLTVVTGVHDLRETLEENTYTIDEIILHPDFYSYELYDIHDIALLKLNGSIKYSSTIRPVCLPNKEDLYDDALASVSGWGVQDENDQTNTSNILKETLLKVLSYDECSKTKIKDDISPEIICAYNNKTDACLGDSGGPLIHERQPGKFELIGVVSWGNGCAQESPGVYTRVSKYLDWIYETTKDATYCEK